MNRRRQPDLDDDETIRMIRQNALRVQRAAEAVGTNQRQMAAIAQSMEDLLREMEAK